MITFITQAIRIGMSFLLGSTGETITEKSGHLNLGIPGIMCVGASVGCLAENIYLNSVTNPNPFLAVLLPLLATFIGSALMGAIYSFLTVTLRANQNVTGLALTTLGIGISKYIIDQILDMKFSQASKYFTAGFPFADKLGVIGDIFFSHGVFVYLAIIIALITSFVLNRTRTGLHLRAVGENPATADAAGVNVTLYRYVATMIGSGVAGIGGLSYIMDNLNGNWEYTVDAIGWLSIALVIFTLWKPTLAIFGSILFGACYIASSYISGISFAEKELLKMFPYIVTIIVLVIISVRKKREHQPPEALGLPYFREER